MVLIAEFLHVMHAYVLLHEMLTTVAGHASGCSASLRGEAHRFGALDAWPGKVCTHEFQGFGRSSNPARVKRKARA